jgi:hypothetical protein
LDAPTNLLSQQLGPGLYIYILGGILLVAGIAHVTTSMRAASARGGGNDQGVTFGRVATITLIISAYAILIERFGYPISTLLFFLAIVRVFGVTSWLRNAALSLGLTAVFYVLFVHYFGVLFPHGSIFDPFV